MVEVDKWFDQRVAEARKHLKTYNKRSAEATKARTKIGTIGLKVKQKGFKLNIFADAIGCNAQTLYMWVQVLEKPIVELKEELEKEAKAKGVEAKIDNTAINRLKKTLKKDTPVTEAVKMYKEETRKSPEDVRLDYCVAEAQSILAFVNEVALEKLDKKELRNLRVVIKTIHDKVATFIARPIFTEAEKRAVQESFVQ
jgi:hypothetical protein